MKQPLVVVSVNKAKTLTTAKNYNKYFDYR